MSALLSWIVAFIVHSVILLFCFLILDCAFCQGTVRRKAAVVGSRVPIPCDFGHQTEAPFWVINGIVYELFSIPYNIKFIPNVDKFSELDIPIVYPQLNGFTFQCGTISNDNELELGTLIELIAVPQGTHKKLYCNSCDAYYNFR